ncbi:MAG: 3-deoxy-8-phosphooctulonate synthase [Oligoflexus sp.]
MNQIQFHKRPKRPFIIAGPCMAESEELINEVAGAMVLLSQELDFNYIFKASFDKANRTSMGSSRGPGWRQTMTWFQNLKERFGVPVLTDVHETHQVAEVAEVCDVLQIPAFLCRQTDLIVEAVRSGRAVNVKKGQFLSPYNAGSIIGKINAVCKESGLNPNFALTERGYSFGYGNLVVDMRSFKIMHDAGAPSIFDITHSLQLPSAGGEAGEISGGLREFAPVLSRAAAASGYVDGFFLEVHTNPAQAKSDASTQLNVKQATTTLKHLLAMWQLSQDMAQEDQLFS